jgi:ornithine cyclodeaminase
MPDPTLWIGEADVVSVTDLAGVIAALTDAFAAEAGGQLAVLDKTMTGFAGHGTLHALGAASGTLAGVKAWAHTPGGADPVLLLFDAATGSLVAAIEAFALGQLRTAGTAALATGRLAQPGARCLAIIGTGKQALAQVAAVAAVRRLDEVRAFSPTPARREAFARRVHDELGLACRAVPSAAAAVAGAQVVTLVTRATQPVLSAAMVAPGMHINAVGAIDLARREFEPEILARATVVTDSLSQARNLSSELRAFYGTSPDSWQGLATLGDVVRGTAGRSGPGDVTVFKGMGSGVEDLAVGMAVLARVRDRGLGAPLHRTGRAAPALVPAAGLTGWAGAGQEAPASSGRRGRRGSDQS